MKINGMDRQFLVTVKAANEIAKYCPDNDFNKFGQMTDGKTFTEIVSLDLDIAEILINEYEQNKAMENEGYVPELVSFESLKNSSVITPAWIHNLELSLVEAIRRDVFGMIEVEETREAKKAKKNAEAAAN